MFAFEPNSGIRASFLGLHSFCYAMLMSSLSLDRDDWNYVLSSLDVHIMFLYQIEVICL